MILLNGFFLICNIFPFGSLMRILKLLDRRKSSLHFIYSNDYWMIDVGKHVFPVRKYRAIYERLLMAGAKMDQFLVPQPASDEDVLLVHTPRYVKKLRTGTLSAAEIAVIELPFSMELVRFAWLTAGGTILAAEKALEKGVAVHIGGGFHHAFHDHGEGFCLVNDVAIALEKLKKQGAIRRAMVVDCDLHQGNGTAHILSGKDYAFTFSIHQMDIYPSEKARSTVDVGLWAGDGETQYIKAMRAHFPRLYRKFEPDLVFYLAGADPFEKDQLGGLRVTKEGLRERDRIVVEEARRLCIPVAIVLAGGYAADVEDTVAIHLNTIKVAEKSLKVSS